MPRISELLKKKISESLEKLDIQYYSNKLKALENILLNEKGLKGVISAIKKKTFHPNIQWNANKSWVHVWNNRLFDIRTESFRDLLPNEFINNETQITYPFETREECELRRIELRECCNQSFCGQWGSVRQAVSLHCVPHAKKEGHVFTGTNGNNGKTMMLTLITDCLDGMFYILHIFIFLINIMIHVS